MPSNHLIHCRPLLLLPSVKECSNPTSARYLSCLRDRKSCIYKDLFTAAFFGPKWKQSASVGERINKLVVFIQRIIKEQVIQSFNSMNEPQKMLCKTSLTRRVPAVGLHLYDLLQQSELMRSEKKLTHSERDRKGACSVGNLGCWWKQPALLGRARLRAFISSFRTLCVSASARLSPSVASNSLQPHGLWPSKLLCPWDSPGNNTGVGSLSLLQGISPTRESNLGLLHCRQILSRLSHQGSPCVNYTSNSFLKTKNITSSDLELYMKKGGDILSF